MIMEKEAETHLPYTVLSRSDRDQVLFLWIPYSSVFPKVVQYHQWNTVKQIQNLY